MKKTFKARIVPFFGIIALLAVIGFASLSLTACPDDSPQDNSSSETSFQPAPAIALKLFAERWKTEYQGEQWTSENIKLSDYTRLKPKKGDAYTFNISGNSDKELKYIGIELFQKPDGKIKVLNSTALHHLNNPFTDHPIRVIVSGDIDARYDVYVQVVNRLWTQDQDGNYTYDSGDKLSEADVNGTLMATISNFTMTVSTTPPEGLTDEERWYSYQDPSSTASLDHFSIDSDNTVKVTVGGIAEPQGVNNTWRAWTVTASYSYTTKTNKSYTYKFMARAESPRNKLNVQYFTDNDSSTYLAKEIELTNTWQTFTIKGQAIPKAGVYAVDFQCANEIGTFYIKMISIAETVSGSDISDFLYEEFEIGKITITGYIGDGGAVTIPESINGKPVTEIGYDAFNSCQDLTSVIIPNGVTSIDNGAFGNCWNLTSVTIPNTVTSIGSYAFAWSGRLASITIPNSVTSIDYYAFAFCYGLPAINVNSYNANYSSDNGVLYNKNRTTLVQYPAGKAGSFTVPNNVTSIEIGAFAGCEKLTGITIGNYVTSIEYDAFAYCYTLTEINVGSANANYSSDNGVLYNKDKTMLIAYPAGKTGSFTIPNSVNTIGDSAFKGCRNLPSVIIPNTVTIIYFQAFQDCTDLTSITIPNSVLIIMPWAFWGCDKLISVKFEGTISSENFGNSYYYDGDGGSGGGPGAAPGDGSPGENPGGGYYVFTSPFYGDLRDKFYAANTDNGTPGTYTTTAPVNEYSVWNKQ